LRRSFFDKRGQALAGVFGRNPRGTDESTLVALNGVATSESAFPIRAAAATALGRLDLSDEIRADLMGLVRADVVAGDE